MDSSEENGICDIYKGKEPIERVKTLIASVILRFKSLSESWTERCEISLSFGFETFDFLGLIEDSGLLRCGAPSLRKWFHAFGMEVLTPQGRLSFSTSENERWRSVTF